MKDQEQHFVPRMLDKIRDTRESRLHTTRENIAYRRARIEEYANAMKDLRQALARDQAELRDLESDEFDLEKAEQALLADIEYIKTLPGVLGTRVEAGRFIVHVRCSSEYDGKLYDFGDFEVTLAPSRQRYSTSEVLDVYCTRIGMRKNREGYYYRHPYFHEEQRRNGTSTGWFCFGNRTDQIRRLFKRGDYGEMMHLVINTMNSVTEGSEDYYQYFTEIPFPVKEQLRRRAVLRITRPKLRPKLP